ncbi:MAG: glycosyltransferase family 2 protein [Lentisphaeria bacterium]|nr:glycosyltransferase family 2 protein [Lentisphaeria bacterium]
MKDGKIFTYNDENDAGKRAMEEESRLKSMKSILSRLLIWGCILASIPVILYFIMVSPDLGAAAAIATSISWWLLIPCFAVSAGTLSYFLMQSLLAYFYRDMPPGKDEELPRLTVIVPAYNEGEFVAKSLASILESDYPAEKLEVIAVNDGSEDDTWKWIMYAVKQSGGRIRALNMPENGGKKHALCAAMKVATGEIVVTVDSDSHLTKSALRKITARFSNKKVGAVAGNIRVSNMDEGAIPKMLEVTFAFGFEFMRTGQSQIHSVLCTPGALSAYRLSAVLPLLEIWKNQTFMGLPSTIGEDRAITSLLIRNGWYVEFQRDAIAFTKMPVTYKGVCKMLIRWCRSDVRENWVMTKYAFGTFRFFDLTFAALRMNLIFANGALILPFFWLPMLIGALVISPVMTLLYTVGGSMLWSLMPAVIYAFRYNAKDALWAFVYGIYSIPFISWICVYSIFTVKNSDWMTRSLAATGRQKEQKLESFSASGGVESENAEEHTQQEKNLHGAEEISSPVSGCGSFLVLQGDHGTQLSMKKYEERDEKNFGSRKKKTSLYSRRLTATQRIARRKLRFLHHLSSFSTLWK